MKILLVHNRYQRPGGEDQVFETERDMLRAHGHEVLTYELHNDSVEYMSRLSLLRHTVWNQDTVHEMRGQIRLHRPAVVHCHNTFPLVSPSVFWVCHKEKVPVVWSIHNYRLACLNGFLYRDGHVCEACFGRFPRPGLKHRCYRGSLAASAVAALTWWVHFRRLRTYQRHVTRFIALSDFERRKLEALGLSADKISVKPNPVMLLDEQMIGERPASAQATRTNQPTALYLGRLSPEKGVALLIRAWLEARDRLPPDSRLLLIGDGPKRDELEALAGDQLRPASDGNKATAAPRGGITFLGQQSRIEVLQHLRQASLLVSPSICYETFGMAAAEAQACGCPVIVPEHGALAELVAPDTTGWIFPAGDSTALADTLVKAFADPEKLRQTGLAAQAAIRVSAAVPARNIELLLEIYQTAADDLRR